MSHQKPSESLYTITLTERQLHILRYAADLMSRLGIGQWREVLGYLPISKDIDYNSYHRDIDFIGNILSSYTIGNVDGWRSNLGICNPDVREESRIAFDMVQVMRNTLAWERARREGRVNEDGSRNIVEMMGVDYDDPFLTSQECPPISIRKVEQ